MPPVCWSNRGSPGLAVSGRNDLSEAESRQLDVGYVQSWSVMGDIVYIFRTVSTMINPSGAY